jgi:GMP synthase (glutamine-hydrolysing)
MKPLLLIKTGTAPAEVVARRGDFERWFIDGLDDPPSSIQVVRVDHDEQLRAPHHYRGAVVTGSAAMVSDRAPWSEQTGQWLATALQEHLPILGICYGHQLLAHALGGRAGPNPRGRQIGTVPAELTCEARTDPLLRDLPSRLDVQTTHVEVALELPNGARLLASTALDPLHAFIIGERCWGLQFHPEFDADVLRGYIDSRREVLEREGLDPDLLRRSTADTPYGKQILRRFSRICRR